MKLGRNKMRYIYYSGVSDTRYLEISQLESNLWPSDALSQLSHRKLVGHITRFKCYNSSNVSPGSQNFFYFRPKHIIFHTLVQSWPISDLMSYLIPSYQIIFMVVFFLSYFLSAQKWNAMLCQRYVLAYQACNTSYYFIWYSFVRVPYLNVKPHVGHNTNAMKI